MIDRILDQLKKERKVKTTDPAKLTGRMFKPFTG